MQKQKVFAFCFLFFLYMQLKNEHAKISGIANVLKMGDRFLDLTVL